jgi:hypothetical protein
VPLCPPQIPHGRTRDQTRASAVGGRRLTTWAMARPLVHRVTWQMNAMFSWKLLLVLIFHCFSSVGTVIHTLMFQSFCVLFRVNGQFKEEHMNCVRYTYIHTESLWIDGRIILKWLLRKSDGTCAQCLLGW